MKRPSKGGPQVRILDAAFSQEENGMSNTLNSAVILMAKGSGKALSYQKSVTKEPISGF